MAHALADGLHQLGVQLAFGVNGAAVGRFVGAAHDAGIRVVHARHEGGAGFMACEASLESGSLVGVFTTTGPGWTNALTGVVSAAREGARIVAVVGGTPADELGRFAFQETSLAHLEAVRAWLPEGLPIVLGDVEDVDSLRAFLGELAEHLARPGPVLACVRLPMDRQARPVERVTVSAPRWTSPPVDISEAVARLEGRRVLLWVGGGARDAADGVRALARRIGAAVICSPRAKGVYPEDDPCFLGVTGMSGHETVPDAVAAFQPDVALVVGSRLGQFTSFYDRRLVPPEGLVVLGAEAVGYRDVPVHIVPGAIRPVLEALITRLTPRSPPQDLRAAPILDVPPARLPFHPSMVIDAVQRVVVDASDAPIIAEAGNAYAWATRGLRFCAPRYRVSLDFGSMGHGAAGLVGLALARGGRAVALVGDGAMLMNAEVSTAVATGAHATWIVFNDGAYGMVHHGMRAIGLDPVGAQIPRVDFAAFARSLGATGLSVGSADALDVTLQQALRIEGPVVVDVPVDLSVPPHFGARNDKLKAEPEWTG